MIISLLVYTADRQGRVTDVRSLELADMSRFIMRFRKSKGQLFWWGPSENRPLSVLRVEDAPITPVFKSSYNHYVENDYTGFLLLKPNHVLFETVAIGEYLRERYGFEIGLFVHVLPELILPVLSFDRPALSQKSVLGAITDYIHLTTDEKERYGIIAGATYANYYTYPSGACAMMIERWASKKFDADMKRLIT